ncbi:MAG: hypothetical protein PHR06_02440 [Candidatus Cloacimonetes bacterium]|nr:hypothetical protein [Candidatus Cloacimonadota bacterium]
MDNKIIIETEGVNETLIVKKLENCLRENLEKNSSMEEMVKSIQKTSDEISKSVDKFIKRNREAFELLLPGKSFEAASSAIFFNMDETGLTRLPEEKLIKAREILAKLYDYDQACKNFMISKNQVRAELASLEKRCLKMFSLFEIPSGQKSHFIYCNDPEQLEKSPVNKYTDDLDNYYFKAMEIAGGKITRRLRRIFEQYDRKIIRRLEDVRIEAIALAEELNRIINDDYFTPVEPNPVINYERCVHFDEIAPFVGVEMDINTRTTFWEKLKGWQYRLWIKESSLNNYRSEGKKDIEEMFKIAASSFSYQLNNYFYPLSSMVENYFRQMKEYFGESAENSSEMTDKDRIEMDKKLTDYSE